MKATLRELWDSREILGKLANQDFTAKVSYKLMKIIDQTNKELQPFSKARLGIFEKYGEKKGDSINILEENKEAFKTEMSDLESTEVDIKFTVTMDEIANAQLTPSELYMLDYMFR
jgi:hypothetical protein